MCNFVDKRLCSNIRCGELILNRRVLIISSIPLNIPNVLLQLANTLTNLAAISVIIHHQSDSENKSKVCSVLHRFHSNLLLLKSVRQRQRTIWKSWNLNATNSFFKHLIRMMNLSRLNAIMCVKNSKSYRINNQILTTSILCHPQHRSLPMADYSVSFWRSREHQKLQFSYNLAGSPRNL